MKPQSTQSTVLQGDKVYKVLVPFLHQGQMQQGGTVRLFAKQASHLLAGGKIALSSAANPPASQASAEKAAQAKPKSQPQKRTKTQSKSQSKSSKGK